MNITNSQNKTEIFIKNFNLTFTKMSQKDYAEIALASHESVKNEI